VGSLEEPSSYPEEGFAFARRILIGLLVFGFVLPVLVLIFSLFSQEFNSASLSVSFFYLTRNSFVWGTAMALGSSAFSLATALPVSLFLCFSPRFARLFQSRPVRVLSLLIFSLPSSALALAILSTVPSTAPLWLQRGLVPVIFAHVFWNHLALVQMFLGKLQNWLKDQGRLQWDSARSLGASPWVLFRHVLYPALLPEIRFFAAAIFFWSLTAFGTVLILGGGPGSGSLETLTFYHLFGSFDFSRLIVLLPIVYLGNLAFFFLVLRGFKNSPSLGSWVARDARDADDFVKNPYRPMSVFLCLTTGFIIVGCVVFLNALLKLGPAILSGAVNESVPAAIYSLILAAFSGACLIGLCFLSVLAEARLHRFSVWAVGFSPVLIATAWSENLRRWTASAPLVLRLLAAALFVSLSLWPLYDFWIARRKQQASARAIEAAAVLGADLKKRMLGIRLPFLSDILLAAGLVGLVSGASDLIYSPILLTDEKTLPMLAQDMAARYRFEFSQIFLLFVTLLLALSFSLARWRTRRVGRC
jgi:ABC-type Fe3+ transport system permease subunit